MPFRWRGVSALSWVTDKRTGLELGHVPRLALPQHIGQYVTTRGASSGFLCMFPQHICLCEDFRRKGVSKKFFAQSLGPWFWARILSKMQNSQLHCSLIRDGVSSLPSSSAGMMSSCVKVPCGFALSAAPESVSALYDAWKCNTLTRSILRDYSSARLDSFFESRSLARDASHLSPGCKFLGSPRFPGSHVASGCSSLRVSSPVSAHPVSWQRVLRSHSFLSREFFETHWIAGDSTRCSTSER